MDPNNLYNCRFISWIGTLYIEIPIPVQTQETHTLVNTVLDVQPRLASSGGGKTSDEIVYELADNILAKIPEKLDIDKALPEIFEVCAYHY